MEYWCYISIVFEYISGDVSADFVNAGERIANYNQLLEFGEGAGVIAASTAECLRSVALAKPVEAAAAVESAARLRDILREVFADVVAARTPDLSDLNAELARALQWRQIRGSQWIWRDAERALESPLWPVILAAANLLTSPDAARLRICDDSECGWLFVDRSRNGLRRWCSMADCGTREKTRRRAARSKQSASVARRAP